MRIVTEKRGRKMRSVDAAGAPETAAALSFDPLEMLAPGDFDHMMPFPDETKHLAQDLGIGFLFFPEKSAEMKEWIEKVGAALGSKELEQDVSRKRESFLFAVALLQRYLPEEQVKKWTERAWKDFKRTKRYNHQIVDTIKAALAVRMIHPDKASEVAAYLAPLKAEAESQAKLSLNQLTTRTTTDGLDTLAMVILAFPELRASYPVPESFFNKIKDRFDRIRVYREPLVVEDVGFFSKTVLDLTILANPETRIDEAGNLVFPRSKSLQKQSSLPPRNEL